MGMYYIYDVGLIVVLGGEANSALFDKLRSDVPEDLEVSHANEEGLKWVFHCLRDY